MQEFRAHAFFGADHPRPGLPARWVSAGGPDAASAAASARELLAGGARTDCGPLSGLRVGLAGSGDGRGQGSELAQRLSSLGVQVEHERVIRFEDLDAGADLAERVAGLRAGDGLVLTSRRAAGRLGGLRVPAGVLLAAVGPATARALEAVGLTANLIGSGGALELARALPLARGARVLFPCAEDAREELEAELSARGIDVERLPLYRTHAVDRPELAQDLDVRIYMSPSAVRAALDVESSGSTPALRIALGTSTAAELERRGLAHLALDPQTRSAALSLDEAVVWRLATLHRDRSAARPIRAATP